METKRKAVVELRVLKMPPVPLEGVRRSARRALPPKRFRFSPETAHVKTHKQKRRGTTTTHNNQTSQNDRQDVGDIDEKVSPVGYGTYSSYELERLENIRQNQVFLSSINLLQATEDLKQLRRPKPSQRSLMKSKAAVNEALPARKSLRLQNIEPKTSTLAPEPRGGADHAGVLLALKSFKKPPGPLAMDPVTMEEGMHVFTY